MYTHKASRHTTQQQQERDRVLQARLRAEGNKSELMCLAYGGRPALTMVNFWSQAGRR